MSKFENDTLFGRMNYFFNISPMWTMVFMLK